MHKICNIIRNINRGLKKGKIKEKHINIKKKKGGIIFCLKKTNFSIRYENIIERGKKIRYVGREK